MFFSIGARILIVLLRNGITRKEKIGKSGRMSLYYCVGKQSFGAMKLAPFLTRGNLERVIRERMERRLKESESVIRRAERHAVFDFQISSPPHAESKFCDNIGLPDRSQPLIAAKRKIPTRHAEAC